MVPLPAQFSDSVVSVVVDRLVEGGPDIRSGRYSCDGVLPLTPTQ